MDECTTWTCWEEDADIESAVGFEDCYPDTAAAMAAQHFDIHSSEYPDKQIIMVRDPNGKTMMFNVTLELVPSYRASEIKKSSD